MGDLFPMRLEHTKFRISFVLPALSARQGVVVCFYRVILPSDHLVQPCF